jgi:hypothetical protein
MVRWLRWLSGCFLFWGLGCLGEGSTIWKGTLVQVGGNTYRGHTAHTLGTYLGTCVHKYVRTVLCLESYYPFYVRVGPASVLTHGGAAGAWRRKERTIAIPCGPSICS